MITPVERPPLESYPAAVLAEYMRLRGVSYFPEVLDTIAERLLGSCDDEENTLP